MSNLRDEIRTLELDQLRSLREFVGGLIATKEAEATRTVWRVCGRGICHGNFREEDYLKAAALLLETAKEIALDLDGDVDRLEGRLELIGLRVPESEYEGWFDA